MNNAEGDIIQVVKYDPAWAQKYEDEAWRLQRAVGPLVTSIQHIGSTAVAGLAGRPVVDIAIAVDSIGIVNVLMGPLSALGYEYQGVPRDMKGCHFFRKGESREFFLYVIEEKSEHWAKCTALRDYMRADPDAAGEYEALKEGLAVKHAGDQKSYAEGKRAFFERATDIAMKEQLEVSAVPSGMSLLGERAHGFGFGLILLLASALLTFGLFFERRPNGVVFPESMADYLVYVLLLAVFWALTASLFLSCSRKSRLRAISEWCHAAASCGLVIFLLAIGIKELLTPSTAELPATAGSASMVVLLTFYAVVGLLSLVRKDGKSEEKTLVSRLSFALVWPLVFAVKARLVGVLFLLLLCGIVYLGERVGTGFGHPLLGACGGLAVILAVLALIVLLGNLLTRHEREDKKV